MWITFGGTNPSPQVLSLFVRSLLWGLGATVIWLVVVWLVVRSGGDLLRAVGIGYLAWGGFLGMLFLLGVLAVPQK